MNAEQQARAIDLVTDLPWADVDSAICSMESALSLALEATREAFLLWERRG